MPKAFDDTPTVEQAPSRPYRRFVLSRFKQVDADEIAMATTTLQYLLEQKDKIKESIEGETGWTFTWRVNFHDLLDQLNRPDAHASLDWLLDTMDDITNPASSLDLQHKIIEWPHLGEQLIGAKAVGNLLLSSLKRQKKAVERERETFNAETQEASARDTFEIMTSIKVVDGTKEKAVAPSSVPMSESNIEAGRIRLYRAVIKNYDERDTEISERIDFVSQCVNVITETYELLLHVSIQNQGLAKNNRQQGA
jgi:hypothetical protein